MANVKRQRLFRQGHLDGLCGIYAIVHAVIRLVRPTFLKDNLPEDMFREAARGLPRRLYPGVLWDGTSPADLFEAAKAACHWLEKETGVGVDVSRPFIRRVYDHPHAFFDAIMDQITNEGRTEFILWIDWPKTHRGGSHWSVFDSISDTCVKLVDSAGQSQIATKHLRLGGDIGTRIDPRWTIAFEIVRLDGDELPP